MDTLFKTLTGVPALITEQSNFIPNFKKLSTGNFYFGEISSNTIIRCTSLINNDIFKTIYLFGKRNHTIRLYVKESKMEFLALIENYNSATATIKFKSKKDLLLEISALVGQDISAQVNL